MTLEEEIEEWNEDPHNYTEDGLVSQIRPYKEHPLDKINRQRFMATHKVEEQEKPAVSMENIL